MVYLLQTPQSVAFCGTVDELYSALSNRPIFTARIILNPCVIWREFRNIGSSSATSTTKIR